MSSPAPNCTQYSGPPDYWHWDAWKVGMDVEDLFGDLHLRFNTFSGNIQSKQTFYCDVWELARKAPNRDKFEEMLADRRALRLKELRASLAQITSYLYRHPHLIPNSKTVSSDSNYYNTMDVLRSRSLDSIVKYFGAMIPEETPRLPRPQTPPDDDRPLCPYESATDVDWDCLSDSDTPDRTDDESVPLCGQRQPRRMVKKPKPVKPCLHRNDDGSYRYLRTKPVSTPHVPPQPSKSTPRAAKRPAEEIFPWNPDGGAVDSSPSPSPETAAPRRKLRRVY